MARWCVVPFFVVCLGWASVGRAEAPADADALSTTELPGPPEALCRLAGLDGPIEPSHLLAEIARAIYGEHETTATNRERLRDYLETLSAARAAWQAASDDGRLGLPIGLQAPAPAVTTALGAVGWRLTSAGGRWRLAPGNDASARQGALQQAGVEPEALASRLESGERIAWPVSSVTVPLPLTPAQWVPLLGPSARGGATVGPAILTNGRTALLYYGLLRSGRGTLAYAGRTPAMLDALGRNAAVVAAFGSAITIEGDQVATPGGPALAAAWEALVRQARADPVPFVQALLERDDGHLAWFYETLSRVPPPTLAYVSGGRGAAPADQAASLAAVYDVFRQITQGLARPQRDPLLRPPMEPSLLLFQLQASDAGRISPPRSRVFWDAAFASEQTDDNIRLAPAQDVDPAFLIAKVFAPERQHRYDRFDAVLFGQRVFANAAEVDLPQAAIVLRGFGRYRSLLLTLERLGVRDVKTYARAVRSAARLGRVGDPDRAAALHAQFQGALALIERLRLVRRLPEAATARLIDTLLDIDVGPEDRYHGAVAAWIETTLFGTLRLDRPADDAPLLDALAGVGVQTDPSGDPRTPPVVWLDWNYRLDLDATTLARLRKARERQGGPPLAAVLALTRVARALTERSLTLPQMQAHVKALETAVAGLDGGGTAPNRTIRSWPERSSVLRALGELKAITKPNRVDKAAVLGASIVTAGDLLLGDVLRSLAYAPYLGEPDGPILLGRDVSERHDFGVTIKDADTRLHAAWSLPQAPTGYGLTWQVWGALLGLDVGLSSLALPAIAAGTPNAARGVGEASRKAMLQGLALVDPYGVTDAEMRAMADAIRRGRARAARAAAGSEPWQAVAGSAGLSAGRVRLLTWIREHPGQGRQTLSMTELLRLGLDGADDRAWGSRWGAPRLNWDGSLLRGWIPAARDQAEAGRLESPLLVAGFPDLLLRLVEVMADLKLPARTIGPLAKVAVTDFLDQVAAGRDDDPAAWAAYAAAYPASRIESAVSVLTADGVLKSSDPP